MYIIEGFKIFKNGIENWFSVALNMFILKRDVDCKIKNIGTVKLEGGKNYLNNSLFRALVSSSSDDLSIKEKDILKSYLPLLNKDIVEIVNIADGKKFNFLNRGMPIIIETFLKGEYSLIPNAENKVLIDIGANMGDTAIYFANKGYDVYAFEPLPEIFDIAQKNLQLNPQFKDKIIFVNKACSCKNGTIILNYSRDDTSGSSSEFTKSFKQIEVETITIEDLIKEYEIQPSILKMDCEGCEVNIIKYSDLSMFEEIIMEFHTFITGVDENSIIKILEKQGFKLNNIKYHTKGLGIIHMKK